MEKILATLIENGKAPLMLLGVLIIVIVVREEIANMRELMKGDIREVVREELLDLKEKVNNQGLQIRDLELLGVRLEEQNGGRKEVVR